MIKKLFLRTMIVAAVLVLVIAPTPTKAAGGACDPMGAFRAARDACLARGGTAGDCDAEGGNKMFAACRSEVYASWDLTRLTASKSAPTTSASTTTESPVKEKVWFGVMNSF